MGWNWNEVIDTIISYYNVGLCLQNMELMFEASLTN